MAVPHQLVALSPAFQGEDPGAVDKASGNLSWLSSVKICMNKVACFKLLMQAVCLPFCLALARAGRSIAARMAMMAMTTSSSINVNPLGLGLGPGRDCFFIDSASGAGVGLLIMSVS